MKIEAEVVGEAAACSSLDPSDFQYRFKNRFGRYEKYYDDGDGPFWIMRNSLGIVGIVRAHNDQDAYDCCVDELLPTVPPEELYEAYGFNNQAAYETAMQDPEKQKEGFDLAEGYSYQSNFRAGTTGIVHHDLNGESLDLLTVQLMDELELTLVLVVPE